MYTQPTKKQEDPYVESLKKEFSKELIDKANLAKKECQYHPARFIQMVSNKGRVETAKELIHKAISTGEPSEGFSTLLLMGRTDLSMEHSVIKPAYHILFTNDEIKYCKELLK